MTDEDLTLDARPENPEQTIPRALIESAIGVAVNPYARYSGYRVGAAAETADGRIFVGTNMENAAYGLTVCAEVGALQAALAASALNQSRRMAIVGGLIHPGPGAAPKATPPCGRCRQLIAQAATLGKYDIQVWFADLDGGQVDMQPISALLPLAFDPSFLRPA